MNAILMRFYSNLEIPNNDNCYGTILSCERLHIDTNMNHNMSHSDGVQEKKWISLHRMDEFMDELIFPYVWVETKQNVCVWVVFGVKIQQKRVLLPKAEEQNRFLLCVGWIPLTPSNSNWFEWRVRAYSNVCRCCCYIVFVGIVAHVYVGCVFGWIC